MNSIGETIPNDTKYSTDVKVLVERLQQDYSTIVNSINSLVYSSGQPTHAAFTGVEGEIYVDKNYVFFCTAKNTWKRIGISSW
jgi:hypothetical protein